MPLSSAAELIAAVAPELADAVRLRADDKLPFLAVALPATGEIVFRPDAVLPGIVCHEVGHLLAEPAARKSPLAELATLVPAVACDYVESHRVSGLPPWFGHDDRWIRAACHLYDRAASLRRWWITPSDLCAAGPTYGLSEVYDYLDALADEPSRKRGETFSEILASPAPAAFVNLWRKDSREDS